MECNEMRPTKDRDLTRRVMNFLRQHFPRLRTVEVEARQGIITIRGRVNSFYERQLCIHCCQRVAGVVRLNDELNVVQMLERNSFGRRHGCVSLAS